MTLCDRQTSRFGPVINLLLFRGPQRRYHLIMHSVFRSLRPTRQDTGLPCTGANAHANCSAEVKGADFPYNGGSARLEVRVSCRVNSRWPALSGLEFSLASTSLRLGRYTIRLRLIIRSAEQRASAFCLYVGHTEVDQMSGSVEVGEPLMLLMELDIFHPDDI